MEVTNGSRVVEGRCLLAERPVRVLERPGGARLDPEQRGPPLGSDAKQQLGKDKVATKRTKERKIEPHKKLEEGKV